MKNIICFSHLRWTPQLSRPQRLMSRFSRESLVFYVEEPKFDTRTRYLDINKEDTSNVWTVVPHMETQLPEEEFSECQHELLDSLISSCCSDHFMFWYYSSGAFELSHHLSPDILVYDRMNLATPENARQHPWERELIQRADFVFTEGDTKFPHTPGAMPLSHDDPAKVSLEMQERIWEATWQEINSRLEHVKEDNSPMKAGRVRVDSPMRTEVY